MLIDVRPLQYLAKDSPESLKSHGCTTERLLIIWTSGEPVLLGVGLTKKEFFDLVKTGAKTGDSSNRSSK